MAKSNRRKVNRRNKKNRMTKRYRKQRGGGNIETGSEYGQQYPEQSEAGSNYEQSNYSAPINESPDYSNNSVPLSEPAHEGYSNNNENVNISSYNDVAGNASFAESSPPSSSPTFGSNITDTSHDVLNNISVVANKVGTTSKNVFSNVGESVSGIGNSIKSFSIN